MKKKRLIRSFDLLKRYKKNLMMMKCCIVFVFLFSLNLSANVYSQKNMVSLDLSDVSVEQFVKAVKQQTEQRSEEYYQKMDELLRKKTRGQLRKQQKEERRPKVEKESTEIADKENTGREIKAEKKKRHFIF